MYYSSYYSKFKRNSSYVHIIDYLLVVKRHAKWEYFVTLANSAVKSDSISDLNLQPIYQFWRSRVFICLLACNKQTFLIISDFWICWCEKGCVRKISTFRTKVATVSNLTAAHLTQPAFSCPICLKFKLTDRSRLKTWDSKQKHNFEKKVVKSTQDKFFNPSHHGQISPG